MTRAATVPEALSELVASSGPASGMNALSSSVDDAKAERVDSFATLE